MKKILTVVALPAMALATLWAATEALSQDRESRKSSRETMQTDEDEDQDRDAERRSYLGVEVVDEADDETGGARIAFVVPGSPADDGGLEAGDVIVRFGGESVRGPAGLTARIQAHEPGQRARVTYVRDGDERTTEVRLAGREQFQRWRSETPMAPLPPGASAEQWEEWGEALGERLKKLDMGQHGEYRDLRYLAPGMHVLEMWRRPKLGVQLVDPTPELRRYFGGDGEAGVLVSKVLRGTPAERAGIKVGDLIVAVDGSEVATADELRQALAEQDGTFSIDVMRDRRTVTVEVTIEEPEEDTPTGPRAAVAPRQAGTPRDVHAFQLTPPPAPPAPPGAPAAPRAPRAPAHRAARAIPAPTPAPAPAAMPTPAAHPMPPPPPAQAPRPPAGFNPVV